MQGAALTKTPSGRPLQNFDEADYQSAVISALWSIWHIIVLLLFK